MSRSESKFLNTALKMDRAMLSLLENFKFEQISVSQICRVAGVNRSTFYDHYQNTYELLKETQRGIMREFSESFYEKGINFPDISKLEQNELLFISPKYLVPYLEYVKKNRKLFKTYLAHLATFEPNEAYGDLFNYVLKPIFFRMGVSDEKIMQYMSKFFLSGITAVVNEWINCDCSDEIPFIVNIIIDCVKTK